jgi:iron complex outermembrane receptor protein
MAFSTHLALVNSRTPTQPQALKLTGMPDKKHGLLSAMLLLAMLSPSLHAQNATPAALKKLSMEELMDVEVTSVSRRPEKLSETASAIQVITNDDIRRAGATSLPEALRLASNLQVAQKNSRDWGISARGFNTELSNKLLVLIDGRTVYTPLYSGVFWDVQDYLLEDVERIEVISGPGGTLWGANAVNGVINIITKNARDTQGVYVEAGGGSELKDFAGARYGGTLGATTQFRVYGKHFDRGDSVRSDGSDINDAWHMTQGGLRVDTDLTAQQQFTVQSNFYDGQEQLASGGASLTNGINVLSRWSNAYADDASISVQVYYDRTHLALPKPATDFLPAGTLTDDLDTYDLDFTHHFRPLPEHLLTWGLGYRYTHDAVQNAPTLELSPERLNHSLMSGFIEDKVALRSDLFLTLGTKLEHNDYTGFEFEPSGRLQWNLSNQKTLWTAISRAVRTPSRLDRDLFQPTGLPAPFVQSILNGSDEFRSETLIAYELGYRAQWTSAFTTNIATFYNYYDHVRSFTPTPPTIFSFGLPFPLVSANNLKGETHGLELSGTYQALSWWQLRGGYTLLKEHLRVKTGAIDFSNALNETADPEHQANLHSSMDLPGNVQVDIGLRWVNTLHNNDGPTVGTVPNYVEGDLRLSWHANNGLEFSVTGQNLLHSHHPEYGYPSVDRAEISRSVVAKAAWRY